MLNIVCYIRFGILMLHYKELMAQRVNPCVTNEQNSTHKYLDFFTVTVVF